MPSAGSGQEGPALLLVRTSVTRRDGAGGVGEVRKNGKLVKQLRRVHVPQKQAASVMVEGIASACS